MQFVKLKRTSFLNQVYQFEIRTLVACGFSNTAVIQNKFNVLIGDNNCDKSVMPDLCGLKAIAVALGNAHIAIFLENGTALYFKK